MADRRRLGGALGASAAVHVALLAFLAVMLALPPGSAKMRPPAVKLDLIYYSSPGAAGGGGGSPPPSSAPKTTVPAHAIPVVPVVAPPVAPATPLPTLAAPVQTDAATMLLFAGSSRMSFGAPGGGGRGDGAGPGDGPGLGPGRGGNTGDGPREVGGDVTAPTVLREKKPDYTGDALRQKITGEVHLEVVVRANGTVGDVRVTRSLDRAFGLDQEAIKAAKQWLFRPGTQNGVRVDVIVSIVLLFRLH